MNILKPRVDRRNATNGVTGMQFPSYEWLTAVGYQVFGFHEALPRLLNWLIYMAGVVAFYYLAWQVSGQRRVGAISAWCLAWSPELFYHGINALPDVLALTSSIAGLYWFMRWRKEKKLSIFIFSLIAVTLGGLTKIQFLVVGFPIGVFVLRDMLNKYYNVNNIFKLLIYSFLAVGLTLTWYRYALQLIADSGLTDFGLEFRPADSLAVWSRRMGEQA